MDPRIEDADPIHRTQLWCIGALEQMQRWGLIKNFPLKLTPVGTAIWDQLEAQWAPDDSQIENFITFNFEEARAETTSVLLRGFRDYRKTMEDFEKDKSRHSSDNLDEENHTPTTET